MQRQQDEPQHMTHDLLHCLSAGPGVEGCIGQGVSIGRTMIVPPD